MQLPSSEKDTTDAYYGLLETAPAGAKQIVGSKSSEEVFGKDLRDPVDELELLCGLFEGYKSTGDRDFTSKAEEYLKLWAEKYDPETHDKRVQISLDQRYFSWAFIEALDCWDALSAGGREAAEVLAKRVLAEEEKFWEHNSNHNNRYSYSNLTRMAACGVLIANDKPSSSEKFKEAANNYFSQVRQNVNADGSSLDFVARDSVHYHVFNQVAWEISRRYLSAHSIEIPEDVTAKLDASLEFALKYISGGETHIEFKHSTHARDVEIQGDKVGKPFDKDSDAARQLLDILSWT